MRRVRAGWFLGLGLVMSGAAISCGSGDSAGLFTASDGGAGTVHGSSGASNQAGAHTGVAGGESGGALNQAGGSNQTSGAPGAGATSTDGGASGSPAGGSMGTAGKGGSTGKAGNGGGGAGGKNGGGGMSGGGAAGATGGAGAGGATAGAGGNGGTAGAGAGAGGSSGGGGAGPVPCSDNAGCTVSQYCAKSDCSQGATGTCTARPTDCAGTAETAMCGCDGFTYHDACLMHLNGENSLAAGICLRTGVGSSNTVTCVAPGDPACTPAKGAGACGFRADTACGLQPAKGICWVLPSTCPTGGGTAKAAEVCNVGPGPNSSCFSECAAVKAQVRYALTANCN